MPSATPRSSITVMEPTTEGFVDRDLELEVAREEKSFETYGGDDPREPETFRAAAAPDRIDPDKVAWDGPDDRTNPQNWSRSYKWFITVICCVMTVNVCVLRVAALLIIIWLTHR